MPPCCRISAQRVAGHRIRSDGLLTDLPLSTAALTGMPDRWSTGDAVAAKFLRWFRADPATRTVSPLSTVTPSDVRRADAGSGFRGRPRRSPADVRLAARCVACGGAAEAMKQCPPFATRGGSC